MRFSWAQHQSVAQRLVVLNRREMGTALALMGVALLMLTQDLVTLEKQSEAQRQPRP